jgi:hypothetical protein
LNLLLFWIILWIREILIHIKMWPIWNFSFFISLRIQIIIRKQIIFDRIKTIFQNKLRILLKMLWLLRLLKKFILKGIFLCKISFFCGMKFLIFILNYFKIRIWIWLIYIWKTVSSMIRIIFFFFIKSWIILNYICIRSTSSNNN